MKPFASFCLALLSTTLFSTAAETALSALRALPRADAQNLVRVEARDGLTSPDHWMFTVYDREAPSSLRVLVVAKGEVVTSQDLSPKEAAAQSKELLESAAIKVDSDQAADLALSYAAANNVKVAAMNFELARQGAKAVPVWIVSCLDQNGGPLGSVVITASRGNVVASEGFPIAPGAAPKVLVSQRPVIRTAAIDPKVMISDREFLAGQAKEPAAPPVAEAPAPLSDVASDAPPAPVESAPPVAAPKESKVSRVAPKIKGLPAATPSPTRIASRKREPSAERTVVLTTVPDEVEPANEPDESFERPRRVEVERFSEEDEPPRKRLHIGRFLHRLLPF